MLQEKTKGNLDAGEERLINSVLTTLRLNFVEESARGAAAPSDAEASDSGSAAKETGEA